jgi:Uma2 family endonuclease
MPPEVDVERVDQRVFLWNQTFRDYEALLSQRGERGAPRMYFLRGTIELMSPSIDHEGIKSTLRRLLEAWADERSMKLNAYGSWTLKSAPEQRGAEPDECYVVGGARKDKPDLAIEVQWTRGGIDKLEIYAGLGVREVWIWHRTRTISVHVLRGDAYAEVTTSELLPDLDLALMASLVPTEDQSEAVATLRRAMRTR